MGVTLLISFITSCLGSDQVRVRVRAPKNLFKLVYDEDRNRAWGHWHLNDEATRGSRPIRGYTDLVKRTGVNFLLGVVPLD